MLLLLILIFLAGSATGYGVARGTGYVSASRRQKNLITHRQELISQIHVADMNGDTNTVEIFRKALEKSYDS